MCERVAVQPGRGALRLARTLLVAIPSVTLSAVAHAAAGGCVTAIGVVLTGVVLLTSTWTQLGRERSGRFLLAWLAVGQLLGHGLLEFECHGPAHHSSGGAVPMLGLHAAAVLMTALLLGIGERRIWAFARLLAAVRTRLLQLAGRFARPRLQPPVPGRAAVLGPSTSHLWHASPWCSPRPVRRGPPGLVLSLR